MTDRFKFSLSSMWLFISLFTIVLPIFLPSGNSPNPAVNIIGTATASMFILSFPSSLFAVPFLMFVNATLGFYPDSISGMYVNLLMLFALGLVQWFWIVPRIWRHDPAFQTIEIPTTFTSSLPKAVPDEIFIGCDNQGETPVERVIRDSE